MHYQIKMWIQDFGEGGSVEVDLSHAYLSYTYL